jgi:hypothetical protein
LLEASNGGTLEINTTVNNASANITAGAGSTVDIINGTIQGGTLNNSAGGILQTLTGNTATLDGSAQGRTFRFEERGSSATAAWRW